jgi:tetratricopeptide (TPR) repeat protein
MVRHTSRYDHVYRDYHDRLHRRIVWPKYHFRVHYSCGLWSTYRYVYPYYHRKYLFVSLGGYWPIDYRYVRYYWYGYYPIAREVRSDTYNYYTYNYYNNDNAVAYEPGKGVDADIFENLAEREPDQATLADVYFEEAVKVFETGNYAKAVEKFARAMELAPDDMILPFAYGQALLANEQYSQAAEVLRAALAKVRPEKEGVFYPRGLYPDEDTLLGHIDRLAEKAELFAFDADLQLLLGYQLLGIGEVDKAVEPLMHASKDLVNADAAAVLLELLEKIKTTNGKAEDAGTSRLPAESNRILAESNRIPVESSRIPAESGSIIKAHSIRFKEGMFLATLCALGTSAGIARYIRC